MRLIVFFFVLLYNQVVKKLFIAIFIILFVSQNIISQDKISKIQSIEIAYGLIDYGKQESSPTALLNAAEILIQNQYKQISNTNSNTKSLEANFLSEIIQNAVNMAPKDELVCLWAKQLTNYLENQNYRGVINTIKYDCNEISKKSTVAYDGLKFSTDEKAEVFLHVINNANLMITISPTNKKEYVILKIINGMSVTWEPEKNIEYTISVTNNSNIPAYYELFLN